MWLSRKKGPKPYTVLSVRPFYDTGRWYYKTKNREGEEFELITDEKCLGELQAFIAADKKLAQLRRRYRETIISEWVMWLSFGLLALEMVYFVFIL